MLQAEILQFKYCRVLSKKPTKKVIESLTAIFDYIFIVGYSPWSNPYFKIIKKQSAVNQFSTNERPSIDPLYEIGRAHV